ncbi:TonB-dependent receptor [Citromicrobium bathyomarinum]|uniref:TonB-dependent receptor n=1 Tax=Citromicrobium bathyomarinum TaxID=72174 RepID=UPI001E3C6B9D|nr:TonB-dependent receptor [Citromicrobium bathyomarinum]MCD1622874.1 TonB-dependent receptor [Citromicrobium bathyomarinum]
MLCITGLPLIFHDEIDAALGEDYDSTFAGAPSAEGGTAKADVEWELPVVPGVTPTGRALYAGEQYVDAANPLEIDSWAVFDLGARYVFAAGDVPVTLRLAVENVGNQAYWASAFDTFSNALLQGRPRTVRASISADF